MVPFAYDWRDSVEKAGGVLRQQIAHKLEQTRATKEPIRIVAHSMGGLVTLAMRSTDEGKQVWSEVVARPGSRLILLGTPVRGSHSITAMLLGRDRLIGQLVLLDLSNSYREVLSIIACYPGAADLLPDTGALDLFDAGSWERLQRLDVVERGVLVSEPELDRSSGVGWTRPAAALLAAAKGTRQRLRSVDLADGITLYVAGCAPATPIDVEIDEQAEPGRRVRLLATEHGDGRVPWESGIPAELRNQTWYMNVVHGDLPARSEHFPALLDLLTTGTTSKLSRNPPARRSAPSERFVLPPEPPVMYPDADELAAAAMGASPPRLFEERRPRDKVRVRVVHGDLSHASSPVFVGHYKGDTIVSAEGYLDRVLKGRLRERLALDLYPGELGSSAVFLGESAKTGAGIDHPGAVLVGLGTVGELAPGNLTATFQRAALLYVAERLECERAQGADETLPADRRLPLSLTTLLIGTGAGGISVASSLQAIIRAVVRANTRLQSSAERLDMEQCGDGRLGLACSPCIEQVEVIELYEDVAIQALRSLLDLATTSEFQAAVEIDEQLMESADGGRRRACFMEDPDWWQRIRIEVTEDDDMRVDLVTQRARAESLLKPNQRRLIDRFLDRASATTANDPELAHTLFELLLPNALKDRAPEQRNVVLLVDDKAAVYPWELLHDRFDRGARPLAVQAGLLRQLLQVTYRERVTSALGRKALVVGDPKNRDTRFPPLLGAEDEARAVHQQLSRAGYDAGPAPLIGDQATPENVLGALYAEQYRILHLAAHGVFEFDPEPNRPEIRADDGAGKPKRLVSGMVLGEGIYLTAAEINQMRFVPDLVFLNCCYLGTAQGEVAVKYHRLAANLATQLIRMGARAVIAAGWAVQDAAAEAFARRFYSEFLGGCGFGESVRRAREECYALHHNANTWGAYQCYGDPDFTLAPGGRSSEAREGWCPVSETELCIEVGNLAQEARTADRRRREELQQRLEAMEQIVPSRWLRMATVRSALGRAHGELRQFRQAVDHYQAVRTLQPARATLESLEQLANLRVRWAAEKFESDSDLKAALELLDMAERELRHLLEIGATPERYSLLGSTAKRRLICLASGKKRRGRPSADIQRTLNTMGRSYKLAYQRARAADAGYAEEDQAYPLQNWCTAFALRRLTRPARDLPEAVERALCALEETARTLAAKRPQYWILALAADATLIRALAKQSIDQDTQQRVVRGHLDAQRRTGSRRELGSTIEHLRFLERIVGYLAQPRTRTDLLQALGAIRESLEARLG